MLTTLHSFSPLTVLITHLHYTTTEADDFAAMLRRAEAAQLRSKEDAVAGGGPGAAVGSPVSGARRVSVVRFQDEQASDPSQLAGGGAGGGNGIAIDGDNHPPLAITRMGSEKSYGSEMTSETEQSNMTSSSPPPIKRKFRRKQSLTDLIHRRAPVEEVTVVVLTHSIITAPYQHILSNTL